jgi:nucleotide-binding universal stress UspA family protein
MKTILFPTDFSINAKKASEYASILARCLDAKIVLLNIYTVPIISDYQTPQDIEKFLDISKQSAISNLNEFTLEFIEKTNFPVSKIDQKVEYGFIGEKILETAKRIKANYIVMGTKGASNAIDSWMGTNAQIVMKGSECPVWIVPEKAAVKYPETILYAADYKNDEILATQNVLEIAKAFVATSKVIHVHDYYEVKEGNGLEEMVSYLEDTFKDDDITFKNIERADTIEGLESYIKMHKPDVLAIGIHDKSFLNKLLSKSVSKHFVQHSDLPLLTFKK